MYVRYIDTQNFKNKIRGIIAEEVHSEDTLLWQKKDNKKYAIFLIEEIAYENYNNNINEKLEIIQRKHKTGILLARLLLSETVDDKRIDYLQAYVEVE